MTLRNTCAFYATLISNPLISILRNAQTLLCIVKYPLKSYHYENHTSTPYLSYHGHVAGLDVGPRQ